MSINQFARSTFPYQGDNNVLFVNFIFNHSGDCAIIEIPEGDGNYKNLLIDMGEKKEGIENSGGYGALKRFLNYFLPANRRKIDFGIISHWHVDHYTDFDKLLSDESISPPFIWVPNIIPHDRSDYFKSFLENFGNRLRFTQAEENEIPRILYENNKTKIEVIGPRPEYLAKARGSHIFVTLDANYQPIKSMHEQSGSPEDEQMDIGCEINIATAKPDEVDNYSLVIRLTFCGKIALFPGDLLTAGWKNLVAIQKPQKSCLTALKQVVKCDLLKVPHHGSTRVTRAVVRTFSPPPQYQVSTFQNQVSRTFDKNGRLSGGNFQILLGSQNNSKGKYTEEVYHMGSIDQLPKRICSTFAFVPNPDGTDAIIVPLICKLEEDTSGQKLKYFIRPSDVESM